MECWWHTGQYPGPQISAWFLTIRSVGSLDWQFSNVTADSTYQFVGPELELDEDLVEQHKVFEMRGTIQRQQHENAIC